MHGPDVEGNTVHNKPQSLVLLKLYTVVNMKYYLTFLKMEVKAWENTAASFSVTPDFFEVKTRSNIFSPSSIIWPASSAVEGGATLSGHGSWSGGRAEILGAFFL